MEASWKSCLEEELLCPICLNVFDEPIQLPCKHNFCRGCISEAWARNSAAARCPECNKEYSQKPPLEKNFKLANIVRRFNALNAEKPPAVPLQCVLCRRGPSLPVRKVCLRCKVPCCQAHIHTHLQQPCCAPGHLLVDPEELSAWTCPSHEEFRLLHCQEEQVALCPFCCISRCTNQRHTVCDVDTQRTQVQAMLKRHQDRLEGRVQNIDEQLSMLESDKTLMKDAVSELRERVRAQYQRMHALLEAKQAQTMQMLESTFDMYVKKKSNQVRQLNERRQEAEKLLSSVQTFFQRADNINFVKNTKPYQLLLDRSNSHLNNPIPPARESELVSHDLLSELVAREKNLQKMLEEPVKEAAVLEVVAIHSSPAVSKTRPHSVPKKRTYSLTFLESDTEIPNSQDPQQLLYSSKKAFFLDQSHHASSMFSSEGLSQNPHAAPGHSRLLDAPAHHTVGLGSSSTHHSGTIFPSSNFPSGDASPQAAYEGRKVLVCTLNNCCCSRAPATRARPPYPASDSFPSMTSQEVPPQSPLTASQPLQHYPIRGLMEASQAYWLYGQSSTKHFGTK